MIDDLWEFTLVGGPYDGEIRTLPKSQSGLRVAMHLGYSDSRPPQDSAKPIIAFGYYWRGEGSERGKMLWDGPER